MTLKGLNVNSEKTLSEGIVNGADMFADDISWALENLINRTPDYLNVVTFAESLVNEVLCR